MSHLSCYWSSRLLMCEWQTAAVEISAFCLISLDGSWLAVLTVAKKLVLKNI